MKTGRALPDVLTELKRQQDAKRDYISPASSLVLQEDGRALRMGENTFDTTELFHRQVASALNIPAKYYDLMAREKPALLAENVNSWFSTKESARLYLKIVNHRLEMACVGDRVQAGVMISNSEVGLGAVSVQPLVYTLACTNGMVVSSLGERKTHVGRQAKSLDESYTIYSDETIEAENTAFKLRLRDATLAAIEEARFAQIVDTLAEAASAPITGRVQDVIEVTGKTYGLNQGEQDDVLTYLIQGGDLSLYGLSNAITRASQDVESYDRATALEAIGWNVATMPAAQWKEINDA